MMICPNCKRGGLIDLEMAMLSFPRKVQRRYRCPHCGYITDELDDIREEETEAQRLMREHLRDYHGVK